jgi:ribosomal-protein-alanine N-acetyltransferase
MIVPESFSTSRLFLRRSRESDAPAIFESGGDPEVARYADWPRLTGIDEARRAVERAALRWESGDEYGWRITIVPDDTPVGGVACSFDGHRAEFGFIVNRRLWSRGYATEAARAVFQWMASLPEVHRVQATCDIDNLASARVLEKLGMRRECVLRRWAVRPNLPGKPIRDAFLYAWVREA